MHSKQNYIIASVILAFGLVLQGCGPGGDRPPLGQVSGTVMLDGSPLAGVILSFNPDEGRASTGVTDADGKYELVYRYGVKGAKIGPHTVTVAWPTGEVGSVSIPAKYTGKSILKKEVKAGSEVMNFELDSK